MTVQNVNVGLPLILWSIAKMDFALKKLDDVQDLLRDLEDFLEVQRDNEWIEFLSDYWKECLVGSVIAGIALYQGNAYLTVI